MYIKKILGRGVAIVYTLVSIYLILFAVSFLSTIIPLPLNLYENIEKNKNAKQLVSNKQTYVVDKSLSLINLKKIDFSKIFNIPDIDMPPSVGCSEPYCYILSTRTALFVFYRQTSEWVPGTDADTPRFVRMVMSTDNGKTWNDPQQLTYGYVTDLQAENETGNVRVVITKYNSDSKVWYKELWSGDAMGQNWGHRSLSAKEAEKIEAQGFLGRKMFLYQWLSKPTSSKDWSATVDSFSKSLGRKIKSVYDTDHAYGISINDNEKLLIWSDARLAEFKNAKRILGGGFGGAAYNSVDYTKNLNLFIMSSNDGGGKWSDHYIVTDSENFWISSVFYKDSKIYLLLRKDSENNTFYTAELNVGAMFSK